MSIFLRILKHFIEIKEKDFRFFKKNQNLILIEFHRDRSPNLSLVC